MIYSRESGSSDDERIMITLLEEKAKTEILSHSDDIKKDLKKLFFKRIKTETTKLINLNNIKKEK